jgi:hypothetical protein
MNTLSREKNKSEIHFQVIFKSQQNSFDLSLKTNYEEYNRFGQSNSFDLLM